ncbi:hypothetical protein QM716_28365 [Rhodococcus sp. IEGM 1409]|uniref:hypothetical protein n=1 Tax=Rhodococcus sp. IEGM 1409 TaxID=3047082 RepID=UPI0024B7E5C4|nr:hypothetical protein [Rhodococcus sp. IEGM 1409]MDI9903784.1 hypothetical protein [Rhodococcus sp. IEGM 1409]
MTIDQFEVDQPRTDDTTEPSSRGTPEYSRETEVVRRIIAGTLAADIRTKLGAPSDAEVIVTERNHSFGYSTLTQDCDFEAIIECAGVSKELYSHWAEWNSLPAIIEWLTEPEPVKSKPVEPVDVPAAFLPLRRAVFLWSPPNL